MEPRRGVFRAGGWPEAPQWAERARRQGPLPFSALGPRRFEPPEPLELLAAWLVDAVDGWWEGEGRPDPYPVVVFSGDDGSLARRVLQLGPRCLPALRYVLVNPVPDAGPAAARLLRLEEPAFLFPSRPAADDEEESLRPVSGIGPLVTHLAEMPSISYPGAATAVAAIGALSRLPADRVEWAEGRWWDVRVAAGTGPGDLEEIAVPLEPGARRDLPPDPCEGCRYALLTGAARWLRDALNGAPAGVLAVVDAWTPETEPLAPAPDGTYGPPALALDQLRRVREPRAEEEGVGAGLSVVTWRIG